MDSVEFVNNYNSFVGEIEQVVKPEFKVHLEKLSSIDPHDLVRPDSYFINSNQARGFVWSLFLKEVKS